MHALAVAYYDIHEEDYGTTMTILENFSLKLHLIYFSGSARLRMFSSCVATAHTSLFHFGMLVSCILFWFVMRLQDNTHNI